MSKYNLSQIMKNAWYNAKRQATKAGRKFKFGSWIEVKEVTAKSIFAGQLRLEWVHAKAAMMISEMNRRVETLTLKAAIDSGKEFTNERFCSVEMVDMGVESPWFENETIVDLV